MKKNLIYSFLKYGYFLDYQPKIKLDLSNVYKQQFKFNTEDELRKAGTRIFRNAIEKKYLNNKQHVVPLSGGMDSRAILSFLKEFTEISNIYTYTFGTPGTYDYEIGNLVAKKLQTIHTSFPLTDHKYTLEEEIEVSNQMEHQTYLFHHAPMFKLLEQYSDMVSWSGYIGDWIAGKHMYRQINYDKNTAIEKYSHKRVMGKNFNFKDSVTKDLKALISFNPQNNPKNISYAEQIEAQNFLVKCTAPHILYKSFEVNTPHIDEEWMNFMMSIPDGLRRNEYLFKRILYSYDRELFSLPIKSNFGLELFPNKLKLVLKKVRNNTGHYSNKILGFPHSKMINYIDFRKGIRFREDLKEIIYLSINDLKKRNILKDIPIDLFWRNHQNGKKDYTNELILLASLEIHLKAGKEL